MKKRWKITGIIGGILILIIGWILISPLFIDNVVNEEQPFIDNKQKTTNNTATNNSIKKEVEVKKTYSGGFVDADEFHKTSGMALILEQEGKRILRLENFKGTNGPDLKVYLATDEKATEFIDLGTLKGNIGNQNYEVSNDIDLEEYDEVLIWCRAFSTLFGSAKLTPSQ